MRWVRGNGLSGGRDVPRLEATHVMVALLSSVLYAPTFYILHALSCALLVDPFGISPHLLGYDFELYVCAFSYCPAHLPLEILTLFFVV